MFVDELFHIKWSDHFILPSKTSIFCQFHQFCSSIPSGNLLHSYWTWWFIYSGFIQLEDGGSVRLVFWDCLPGRVNPVNPPWLRCHWCHRRRRGHHHGSHGSHGQGNRRRGARRRQPGDSRRRHGTVGWVGVFNLPFQGMFFPDFSRDLMIGFFFNLWDLMGFDVFFLRF